MQPGAHCVPRGRVATQEQQTLKLGDQARLCGVGPARSCPAEVAGGAAVFPVTLACDSFSKTACRVNVDFQKQTVDPVQVSFSTTGRSRLVPDLFLTVDVTEVGPRFRPVSELPRVRTVPWEGAEPKWASTPGATPMLVLD